jgi:glycerate kinase
MVNLLDRGLHHFAQLIRETLDKSVAEIAGSGAAGGLGAGFLAFTPAILKSGFEIVKNVTQLDLHIRRADLVFTGEGKIDHQTQFGKTPFGVAQIAKNYNKPVIALAGSIGEGAEVLLKMGVTALFSITNGPMSLEESLKRAPALLKNAASEVMRLITIGK